VEIHLPSEKKYCKKYCNGYFFSHTVVVVVLLLAEGGDGTQGRVTSVEDHHPSYRSCVKIEWKAGRTDYIRYHRGYKGSVDIKCVTAADGETYYEGHLPKLGNYELMLVI